MIHVRSEWERIVAIYSEVSVITLRVRVHVMSERDLLQFIAKEDVKLGLFFGQNKNVIQIAYDRIKRLFKWIFKW